MEVDGVAAAPSKPAKGVSFAEDIPLLSAKAKRRVDVAASEVRRTKGGRRKRRRENDSFVQHPLSERLGDLLEQDDLLPPSHSTRRPGPFAALRQSRQDLEKLLFQDGIASVPRERNHAERNVPAVPRMSKSDRRLRKAIAGLPGMWPWIVEREEELIKFALERVHGRWQEVITRNDDTNGQWTTVRSGDDEPGSSDESGAESDTVYVSTVGGTSKTMSSRRRRASLDVRDVPEFLLWHGQDAFGRLVLHSLARYYSMNSQTLVDENSETRMILVRDRAAGHGPLPLVRFSAIMCTN